MKRHFLFFWATGVVVCMFSGVAFAGPRVYGGEFIIIEDESSPIAAASGMRELRRIRKKNGQRFRVVREESESQGLQDYDAAKARKWCAKHAPKAKICEPNFELKASAIPNDPDFALTYGMTKISAPQAWDQITDASSVIVAVIDTGIDYNHNDLAANIWTNPGEIAGNNIDDDNNGYIDDVHGINVINGSGDPMDDNGHGTHCAGTIGARGDNGIGVAGVAWSAKLLAGKFLNSGGEGKTDDAIIAVDYAVEQGAKVISASFGGGGFSQALYDSIKAAGEAGVVFVAAAGNAGNDNDLSPSYPATYDLENIVSVAASRKDDDNLASFSNYGATTVDIAAPGVNIWSTVPGNQYTYLSGTSMATPHVAGMMAILRATHPADSVSEQITRLFNGADDVAELSGKIYTGRRANLLGALSADSSGGYTPVPPGFLTPTLDALYGMNRQEFLIPRVIRSRPFYAITSGGEENATLRIRGRKGMNFECPLGRFSAEFAGILSLQGSVDRLAKSIAVTFGSTTKRLPIKQRKKQRRANLSTLEADQDATCQAIASNMLQIGE